MSEITTLGSNCDCCNRPFIPREALQRFCSVKCKTEWWIAERSRAMAACREHKQQEERAS